MDVVHAPGGGGAGARRRRWGGVWGVAATGGGLEDWRTGGCYCGLQPPSPLLHAAPTSAHSITHLPPTHLLKNALAIFIVVSQYRMFDIWDEMA